MVARLEQRRALVARDAGADRKTSAQPLGHGDDVGPDTARLPGPEVARAAHAALDLVEDERGAGPVAGGARRLQQVVGQDVYPGLALDRLEHHGRRAPVHGGIQRRRVLGHDDEPRHERRERLLLGLLRGRRQRAVGAAVEGPLDDDDVPAATRLADELDRGLHCLGAGVAEVDLAAERALGQPRGQPHRRLGVEEVRDVHEPRGLILHGAHDLGVAVPDARHADAREEVEVLAPLVVPQPRALAAHELDGKARVGRNHALALERLELGQGHARIFVPMPASVNSSSSSVCGARPSTM